MGFDKVSFQGRSGQVQGLAVAQRPVERTALHGRLTGALCRQIQPTSHTPIERGIGMGIVGAAFRERKSHTNACMQPFL